MVRVDPRLRQRADSVSARITLSSDLSNQDLLAHFQRSLKGKLSQHTIDHYLGYLRDIAAYLRVDGREISFSKMTKSLVWEYIHHAQANYCRYFRLSGLDHVDGVYCSKKVWRGVRPPAEVASKCATCPLFESSQVGVGKRIEALSKFFQYLSRVEVVESNFVRDIVSEYRGDCREEGRREKRRNPSVEEVVRLVNGTHHPRNRAFYACNVKWWFRINEMFMLDRYESFPNFTDGGDLVVLPRTKGVLDKRKGNRVSVIDAELRPILKTYFDWWDRNVRRDAQGRPYTTRLWLNFRGTALNEESVTTRMIYADCERLGLMQPGDRDDPLKRWTVHCNRHFGEKLLAMADCPETWRKHFRGDVVKDAMGQYFVPTPEQVREKYLQWVPKLGLMPTAMLYGDGDARPGPLVDSSHRWPL